MKELCFRPGDILLPRQVEMEKWSVVACDQYTSEPAYWEAVKNFVGTSPSTYHITLPEIYLEESDVESRIEAINATMERYLKEDLFTCYKESFFYIERTMENGAVRHGILGVVDLEEYDYNKGSQSQIRATEGTVLERIGPRVKVRENAPLELPHVMLLIDDEEKTVIEPLAKKKGQFQKVYDFELMQQGGHIAGYRLTKEAGEELERGLSVLADPARFSQKYGVQGKGVLTLAAGDGNHSLATAKACYEAEKKRRGAKGPIDHPSRYALAEVVNVHDDGLSFEPIHRVLFGVDAEDLLKELGARFQLASGKEEGQSFSYVTSEGEATCTIKDPTMNLAVGTIQQFLDGYLAEKGGRVDYIHGDDVVRKLGSEKGNMGFLFPAMEKRELFRTVIFDGVLPRKTFSMGHANEKRFYLECRKIK